MGWKTGPAWEAFLLRFITSPAAAGTAALLAAIIAARSFAKGLKHTKEEAQANRRKEAAEAWWEQFEWVSDRIVPKDPKQERLHNGLATALLGALETTADGDFQREAVDGIRHTYIRGSEIPLSEATLGELRARLREVRTFADGSWISGDESLQSHFRAHVFLLETLVALRTVWKPGDIVISDELPRGNPQFRVQDWVDAVVRIDRHWVAVNTTQVRTVHTRSYVRRIADRLKPEHMNELNADFVVVVSRNQLRPGMWQGVASNPTVRLIHWDPKEGAAELRKRMELHIGADSPASRLAAKDEVETLDTKVLKNE
ncbi:hypothetical protein ITX31_01190 [Arthrobacter gandavensis]|uniref:hypothetical protein n=1 Tax=Arthrobacter gandavensis TaxID=169960 RepID=UPI00188EE7A6|nr:hypothetical protein [Arthrobacter gandavensis]MBF4992727.1 hypothetical protein [Arthrobacter gandavensis]